MLDYRHGLQEGARYVVKYLNAKGKCPKDPYPLPRIDQIVDSTAGCELLCFLDAFSGYHQIKMAKEDEEKIAFLKIGRASCRERVYVLV